MPDAQVQGPFSYENWKQAQQGVAKSGEYEYPLYTDAHITGSILEGYGPYEWINTVPDLEPTSLRAAIVLRVENYLDFDVDMFTGHTNDERYHGGVLYDEIAALTSLCLGIRLKAGFCNRAFESKSDPRGTPVAWYSHQDPVLPPLPRRLVLPWALSTSPLEHLAPLQQFTDLSPQDAIVLVRAARLYQDAMWIAESEPALAWLMFVSAVETAAISWSTSTENAEERFRISQPDVAKLLESYGGENLVRQVAQELASYMGVTGKFVRFLLRFLPQPPLQRPDEYARINWTSKSIKGNLEMIYKYRSRALHGGKPFPAPMCAPPPGGPSPGYAEHPLGSALATGSKGSVWVKKDVPMSLHIFEFIVRHALLGWWASLTDANSSGFPVQSNH